MSFANCRAKDLFIGVCLTSVMVLLFAYTEKGATQQLLTGVVLFIQVVAAS